MRTSLFPFALITLAAFLVVPVDTQTQRWPPILFKTPSDPAAPAAAAFALTANGPLYLTAVAADALGNMYVAGWGSATEVPGLARGFQPKPVGGDAFVAKVGPTGTVIWATYLGGTDGGGSPIEPPSPDQARAIAVDATGNVYVAGTTAASNFPIVNAFQPSPNGGFIAKISADGRRLLYSSYVGSTGAYMSLYDIAVGPAGEVWLAAYAYEARYPASHDLSGGTGDYYVLKLNPAGSPIWSTRVGLKSFAGFGVDAASRPHIAGYICGFSQLPRRWSIRVTHPGCISARADLTAFRTSCT